MPQPIRIHYDGHAHSTELPITNEEDDAKAWRQALEHVYAYVAPHGASFHLHGRGYSIHFVDGTPREEDTARLEAELFEVKPRTKV